MQEEATEITYDTFLRNVETSSLQSLAGRLRYEKDPRNGLTLKRDPFVKYFKSHYQGTPCYYLCHSRIEYIFF